MKKHPMYNERGLTLLELIVIMAMISIFVLSLFSVINPGRQLEKSQDGQRRNEINQIKNALDLYYNDNSCYPTSIPFGEEWRVGNTVYMNEVPKGISCENDPSKCYIYFAEGSCPQWNAVFAKLSEPPVRGESCNLEAACLPQNYSDEWICTSSGFVNCGYLSADGLPTADGAFCPSGQRNYSCTGSPQRCNVVPNGTGTYCSSNCEGSC